MPTSSSATRSNQYDILIHSLTHEHSKEFFDRHVLLFEKWCRDYNDGLFISDLDYVITVFSILRERLLSHYALFRPVLSEVLKICAKPLLESKANERLRPPSIDRIGRYFLDLAFFFKQCDSNLGKEIAKCFRCIVAGGDDPTILKVDRIEWVGDGSKLQITDRQYIQSLLREGKALEVIVSSFLISIDSFMQESNTISGGGHSNNNDADNSTNQNKTSRNSLESLNSKSEYMLSMLDLSLELAEDTKTASDMCLLHVCDGSIKILRHVSSLQEGPRHVRIPDTVELMWLTLECYQEQVKGQFDGVYDASDANNLVVYRRSLENVMDFEAAVSVLQSVLLMILRDGYRLVDKECRNEIIITLTLIAEFPGAFPCFLQSGLLTVLLTYACVGEMGKSSWAFFDHPLAKLRNFFNAFDVDMQFKRELWILISDLVQTDDADALLCVASSPFMSTMMLYLEFSSLDSIPSSTSDGSPPPEGLTATSSSIRSISANANIANDNNNINVVFEASQSTNNSPSRSLHTAAASQIAETKTNVTLSLTNSKNKNEYHPLLSALSTSQLREFQILAMGFLAQNSPKMIGEFLRINGPLRILDVTIKYCSSPIAEHKALVLKSLLLINRCVSCSEVVKEILESDNAMQIFLYLFENSTDDTTRSQAVRLISLLCAEKNENSQTQLRKLNGIEQLIAAVSTYAKDRKTCVGIKARVKLNTKEVVEIEDPSLDSSADLSVIIVSVLDCISRSVVGNNKNELRFAKKEGIDALLDLLEVSPFVLRVQVLRLLSDILENQLLLMFVHAWRSFRTMRSASQVITHCWLDEEVRLQSSRENGIIANLWDPLGNQVWPKGFDLQLDGESLSETFSDGLKSLAVSRLAMAIIESRSMARTALSSKMKAAISEKDSRGIIANILRLLGLFTKIPGIPDITSTASPLPSTQNETEKIPPPLSPKPKKFQISTDNNDLFDSSSSDNPLPKFSSTGDLGLSPSDKQVIAMAKRYSLLREGEWWASIREYLTNEGIDPIEVDKTMVNERAKIIFDATLNVQLEQMSLHDEDLVQKGASEKEFTDAVITQKNQQIKAEWIKRNAKNKNIMNPTMRK